MTLLTGPVVALGVLLAQPPAAPAQAQSTAQWRDPSPHQVRFVSVDSGVRLEVLDWGGSGRPVVFIGCYLTAHVYDNIAPEVDGSISRLCRHQARRGRVRSSGDGIQSAAQGGRHPRRDRRVEDAEADPGRKLLRRRHPAHARRSKSRPPRRAHVSRRRRGSDVDEGGLRHAGLRHHPSARPCPPGGPTARLPGGRAVRQRDQWPLDPAIRKAIVEDNRVKPDYAHIRVPVVAVYRTTTMEQALEQFPPKNEQERAALKEGYAVARGMLSKWQRRSAGRRSQREDRRAARRQSVHVPVERGGHHSRAARVRVQSARLARHGEIKRSYFFLTPSSSSFFTITSPAVAVVGDLSMARIFPSPPM